MKLKMLVRGKEFGKPFITYEVKNEEDNEVIDKGKCKEYERISEVYFGLISEYGQENVRMLSR